MINTSDNLVILPGLSKQQLRQALACVGRDLHRASDFNGSKYNHRRLRQFEKLSEVLDKHTDPKRSVHEVFQMLMGRSLSEEGVAGDLGYHRYSPTGGTLLSLRSICSALLFQLWCQRSLVLPYCFNFQKTISSQMRSASSSSVVSFLSKFEARAGDTKRFGVLVSKRMKSDCWAWLFTTSWVDFEDITLEDYQKLTKSLAAKKRSKDVRNSPSSVKLFVSVALVRCPNSFLFSTKEFGEIIREIRV